jgi:RNA-directed DNA polymerase
MTRWTPTFGSPEGAVTSPLLANVHLHELDVEMRQAGLVMVRYADDAMVLMPYARGSGRCAHPPAGLGK